MNDSKNEQEVCWVCGKSVSNGWFARIRREKGWVKLCSPLCSARYADGLLPPNDEYALDSTDSNHKPCFVVNGELWS